MSTMLRWHMRMIRTLIVLAIVVPLYPATASALDLYIAPDGSDAADGLSPAAPVATLQRAHDVIAQRLASQPEPATLHVAPGVYRDQLVRWSFSMQNHPIVIQGDQRQRPVFDGSGLGKLKTDQVEFLYIARGDRTDDGPTNIHVRNLQIQNYLEAIWIRGARSNKSGYNASEGGNIIEGNRFVDIGAAFSKAIPPGGHRVSHGAILIRGSRGNVIRNNEFVNITNDAKFPASYSTYGGLHAIYVMLFSSNTLIENNTFSRVFARGVIKFRGFSNFGRVIGNHFLDDTSLLRVSYCDDDLPVCRNLPATECPPSGIEFSNNTYRYYRGPNERRPTLDIDDHPANDNYCGSERFWKDSGLDPRMPFNQVRNASRLTTVGNKLVKQ